MRWDFHKHKTYLECPCKYDFQARRVEPTKPDNRYYAVRGTVMQKFFELYANKHYPATAELTFAPVRKFLKPFYDRELGYNYIDWSAPMCKQDREGLLDEIVTIIAQNLEKMDHYAEGTQSELKIVISLKNGDELVGKIDFVKEYADGTVALMDGKSTGTLNKGIDVDQMLFYAWLHKVKRGKIPEKLGFVYYQLLITDWKTFDKVDIERVVRSVLGTLEAAKTAKVFPPTPSAGACKYCSYMDKCPEGLASKESRKRGSKGREIEDAIEIGDNGFLKPMRSVDTKAKKK